MIIDNAGIIRHSSHNDLVVERNFDEILRQVSVISAAYFPQEMREEDVTMATQ